MSMSRFADAEFAMSGEVAVLGNVSKYTSPTKKWRCSYETETPSHQTVFRLMTAVLFSTAQAIVLYGSGNTIYIEDEGFEFKAPIDEDEG